MSEMVERVARAIAEARFGIGCPVDGDDRIAARAAIEATETELRREIERDVRAKLRLEFRKALAALPVIAPPQIASILASAHMRDEFFEEGKRLQREHGIAAVAPRVEQECGAGAWSFMRAGVYAALTETQASSSEIAVQQQPEKQDG